MTTPVTDARRERKKADVEPAQQRSAPRQNSKRPLLIVADARPRLGFDTVVRRRGRRAHGRETPRAVHNARPTGFVRTRSIAHGAASSGRSDTSQCR